MTAARDTETLKTHQRPDSLFVRNWAPKPTLICVRVKTHTLILGLSAVFPALTSPFVFIRAATRVFSSRTLSLAHYGGFASRLWGGSASEEFHNVLPLPN